tara:strand:+ start:67 stop:369 length:303 start_codon:yes stop_codon:yes gene_type:complete
MWKMQKKSIRLLESEAKELGDVLTHTLYSIIDSSLDSRHTITILLDKGLINETAIRDIAVINDFDTMYKNPLAKNMDIYYNLSVKYDLSVNHIRRIIRDR